VDYLSRRERAREMNKTEIIAVAEKVFCKKGYMETSMDDIAKQSGFTKRTVYQYFLNKQDLYSAVACKKYEIILDVFKNIEKKEMNGFKKIHEFVFAYYHFYRDDPTAFLMLKYSSVLEINEDDPPFYNELKNIKKLFVNIISKTIEMGKIDKSIRHDIDAVMGTYTIIYFTMGFFYRLIEVESNDFKNNEQFQDQFIRFSLELLINVFKS
jgi:AcrR family transcriptional regulator